MLRMLYIKLTVIKNQKSITDTQNIKRKESKCITKQSHQTTREENKKRNREKLQKQP